MTVIAYDGRILATDRRCVMGDVSIVAPKFTLAKGHLFMSAGVRSARAFLVEMFLKKGQAYLEDNWPDFQRNSETYALLVIGKPDGTVWHYDITPALISDNECGPIAFGSGREVAMGAMLAGASALRAVEICCSRSPMCGGGVDAFKWHKKKWSQI